jgi:hypothetical protein
VLARVEYTDGRAAAMESKVYYTYPLELLGELLVLGLESLAVAAPGGYRTSDRQTGHRRVQINHRLVARA